MEDLEKRNHVMNFRVNDIEKKHIQAKYEASKQRSLSDFMRKEIVFGKVFSFDNSDIDYLKRQIAGACVNINQIALRANQTRRISQNDIAEIQKLKSVSEKIFHEINEIKNVLEQRLWQ